MKKKNIKQQWVILCLIILLMQSCEREKLNKEYYLTEDQKKLVPYTGYDKIIFKTNKGDTIIYNGIGYSRRIEKYVIEKNKLYDLYEAISYNYYCKIDSYFLDLNISANYNSGFAFGISWYKKNTFDTKINLTLFDLSSTLTKDITILKKDSLYYDIFNIGTYQYEEVYKITDIFLDNPKRLMIALYYNIKKGIIKVEFDNNEVWEIVNK